MGIFLGLSAACSWGLADFLARFAARRIGAYRTLFFMQLFGFLGLTAYLFLATGMPRLRDLAHHMSAAVWTWTIVAALLNVVASLALYRAFATGVLAVVAPVAASYPVLTMVLDFWSGERLTAMRGFGLIAALVGVVFAATPRQRDHAMVGSQEETRQPLASRRLASGVGWAIFASVGFGFMFWLLGFHVTPVLGGVALIWIFRLVALLTLASASVPARQTLRLPDGRAWWLLAGTGCFDTVAFVATAVGLTTEQVSVVTVLSSLFGAVTVGLAWVFLRERLHWSQWIGVVLIFAGIVLVSV